MLTLKHFLQVVGEMNEKNDNPNVFFFIFKIMEIPYSRIFWHLPLSYILQYSAYSFSHFTSHES